MNADLIVDCRVQLTKVGTSFLEQDEDTFLERVRDDLCCTPSVSLSAFSPTGMLFYGFIGYLGYRRRNDILTCAEEKTNGSTIEPNRKRQETRWRRTMPTALVIVRVQNWKSCCLPPNQLTKVPPSHLILSSFLLPTDKTIAAVAFTGELTAVGSKLIERRHNKKSRKRREREEREFVYNGKYGIAPGRLLTVEGRLDTSSFPCRRTYTTIRSFAFCQQSPLAAFEKLFQGERVLIC